MKMFKLSATVIAITAALVSPVAFGGEVGFVFNEYSDTVLTATYNGTPLVVTNISLDRWFFYLPLGFPDPGGHAQQWIEPENSNLVNWVDFNNEGGSGHGSVYSELEPYANQPTTTDGTTVSLTDFGGVSAVFYDHGDVAVPDTGSTEMLLSIGLAGLGFLRRKIVA
jgi:hypothetical protein